MKSLFVTLLLVVSLNSKAQTAKPCKSDSLVKVYKTKLFIANYKIERVKYYLKICQRHPSQTKFLVSWINRAIQ